MTKEQIRKLERYVDRENFRCIHGHTGLAHRRCYDQAKGVKDRIGFFDIETSDLLADWGFVLSYCIKPLDGKVIKRLITPEEVLNDKTRDKRLIKQFCEDVHDFDTLAVYYGKDTGGRYQRHDIPFMRTRAVKWGLDFPIQKQISIIDVYDVVKSKFKMKRNSMQHACQLCGIESKATPHDFSIWQRARDGNKTALNLIMKHNVEDVISLELLWKKVYQYKRVKVLI